MKLAPSPTNTVRAGHTPMTPRRGDVPVNFRSVRQPYPANSRRDRPPGPLPGFFNLSNFTVDLRSDNQRINIADVEGLVGKCNSKAEKFAVYNSGVVAARLSFRQWTDTLETMVFLWKVRLDGTHSLTPCLVSHVYVRSDIDELISRLKTVFSEHLRELIEGNLVQKWKKKMVHVSEEIASVSTKIKRLNRMNVYNELLMRKEGLVSERELIEKKIEEFKSAMKCILSHLDGKSLWDASDERVDVFRFDRQFEWERIHYLIRRECQRLEDGLPIYAGRQDILSQFYNQQIMVLIGETGSGKSTQLVQFLVDSGLAANESIVCTQPRKLAAISLAHRVQEECYGCYQDNSIMCHPTYSSAQKFDSKVIYMTDHCLLQHYMKDKNLSGISCIIVDEAHERSLNTDLILALIKNLLQQRSDLRLIIMSATADAKQFADYFFGCGTFHVVGRRFPVDVKYVPCASEGTSGSDIVASYASDVVRMATEIHRTEKDGTILAFLTSQIEVEWACEKFQAPSAIALPLHGKLSYEDQHRIFHNYSGKRKVIFATNLAETSLTIPGVKYVIDSGLVKESRFEPCTGMSVLKVCWISQSSANQRAGRAGRTEPGRCYRLYSKNDFELMSPHQDPEIRRVHLGVAVLRILALGIKNVQGFDFVDAPCAKAIEMAIRNLIQLGAVTLKNDVLELTEEGQSLVRLGIEPRLGKIILNCFHHGLGREGLVLASVMANVNCIFCRVGNEEEKLKSDSLRVQFCHHNGDLFTLLSVYKEWDNLPREKRNKWCWDNSINAKTMRRCQDTVQELATCLQNEFNFDIPSKWLWNPEVPTEQDKILKDVILSSLAENVAMYSGYDQLGYEVASTGTHVQLHPSSSLLVYSRRPSWVVFGEILSISNQYLVCVTAFDFESLATLCPPSLFDVSKMESRKLQVKILSGFGRTVLKKFCGKSNNSLLNLVSRIRKACMDERIGITVNVDRNEVLLFASSLDMDKVYCLVNEALEYERKWLQNECMEKFLYHAGHGVSASVALFGAGAEIKHLELEKRCLTVDVFHSNVNVVDVFHSDVNVVDDKELLMFFERKTSGSICAVHKFTCNGKDNVYKEEWGRITFLTPHDAMKAAELNEEEFRGALLKVVTSRSTFGGIHKMLTFPAVRAKVYWPRRYSKGFGILKCSWQDVDFMVADFSNALIGRRYARSEASIKYMDSVVIGGLDRELSEAEILNILRTTTSRKILDFFLVRGDAIKNSPCDACKDICQCYKNCGRVERTSGEAHEREGHMSYQPHPNHSTASVLQRWDHVHGLTPTRDRNLYSL